MDEKDRQRYYEDTGILVGNRTNDRSVQQQRRYDAINPPQLQLKSLHKKMPDYVEQITDVTTDEGDTIYRNYRITDRSNPAQMTGVVWIPSKYAEYREGIGLPGVNGPEYVFLQTPIDVAERELERDLGRPQMDLEQVPDAQSFWASVEVMQTNEKFTVAEVVITL